MSTSQLSLDLKRRTWGGVREGAGRKPAKGKRHDPPHRSREQHVGRYPLHIVLRVRRDVGRVRGFEGYRAARSALRTIGGRTKFRIVHLSLQHNHVHLLVEADDSAALESGMRAFAISFARHLNRALGRSGKVFEFRYHTTRLTSPTQVRNAIAYVLNNWRRHREDERGYWERFWKLDHFSTAILFRGWHGLHLAPDDWPQDHVPLPVSDAQTWLLATGWSLAKRPIRAHEIPGPIN